MASMEQEASAVYYSPNIHVFLCRRRITPDWIGRKDDFAEPFWRFYWCPRSVQVLRHAQQEYTLRPGEFTLIPPNTSFSVHAKHSFDQFYIHFTASLPYSHCVSGVYQFPLEPAALDWIRELTAMRIETPNRSREASLATHQICLYALRKIPDTALCPHEGANRLQTILDHITNCFPDCPDNTALAEVAQMSSNALIRLFKQQMQLTPQQYVLNLRIDRAKMLLRFSDRSIEAIADECGFSDRSHLTRMFVTRTGRTPADYRRLSTV